MANVLDTLAGDVEIEETDNLAVWPARLASGGYFSTANPAARYVLTKAVPPIFSAIFSLLVARGFRLRDPCRMFV